MKQPLKSRSNYEKIIGYCDYSLFANTFQEKLVSYGNQSIDLQSKSIKWFLCDEFLLKGISE